MAKLHQGILGAFSGKVGTVVGYLWRGRQVVRAYRKEINYPNTESQRLEREWFVSMVRFAATARQALLLGLRERAARDQMTEGNAFVKMNKHCFGRTHALVAACGGATPSSLEGELKCLQPNSSPSLEGELKCLQSNSSPSLEGEQKSLQPNSSPKLGEVPEGRRSVLQDGGEYGSKATRPRPSGTPSNLEGVRKCRDAACRVRNAPASIPARNAAADAADRSAAADAADRGASADAADRGAVADAADRGAMADAARCVPTEYERIRISEGSAAPVLFREANISNDGILRVDFEKNTQLYRASPDDRVYVYAYCPALEEGFLTAHTTRKTKHLRAALPDHWRGQEVKLWGFVVDREGRASNSAYIAQETAADTAEPIPEGTQHITKIDSEINTYHTLPATHLDAPPPDLRT